MDEEYLKIMGKMTYGIYVMTSRADDVINGMIASWVSQMSYDPLLIGVAVHTDRYTHELVKKTGRFALNIISKSQKEYLKRFKGPDPKSKFSSIGWETGVTGVPVLKECIGYVECRVREIYSPGNHTFFVGEVRAAKFISDDIPLITMDYDGVYTGRR